MPPSAHAVELIVLAACGGGVTFYAAYVVKARLGIDLFPHWGLHLPGPRSLYRRLRRRMTMRG